eukprot:TRINITY_DN2432_c0_g1_i1.p1 TRINITY_DN2432_c0_g1~~TRINITY_DN2432_c0_g1_i1.p1  ORF type:complete len:305 (-),score=11.60 TRINITY_DN2432_c0_g1_i1:360-1274(-)
MTGKKKYETWPGKNHIFCHGRLMAGGGSRGWFWFTHVLFIIPAVLFSVDVCPWLAREISPAVVVIFAWLTLACVVFFYMAAFSDPGITPRQATRPKKRGPSILKIDVNGVRLKMKFCETCNIYRPPRTSHCSVCDNCIDRFDHHCPWIGNCIGKRNYHLFLLFVFTITIQCFYVLSFSLVKIVFMATKDGRSGIDSFTYIWADSPLVIPIALFMFIVTILVCSLASFHLFLIATGQTTYEKLKKVYKTQQNPFTKGPLMNFVHLLFQPWSPAYIHLLDEDETTRVTTENATSAVPVIDSLEVIS